MNINPRTITVIFIGAGLLQSLILLAFLLTRANRKNPSTTYLILLIGALWFQMAFKALNKMDLIHYANFWYCVGFEMPILYGPLLYGYTFHAFTEGSKFKRRELVHVLPFAFFFSVLTIFAWTRAEWCSWFFFPTSVWHGVIHFGLQITSIVFYAMKSWKIQKVRSSVMPKKIVAWHRQLIILLSITAIIIMIVLKFLYYQFPNYDQWRPLFVILIILPYWISYKVLIESSSKESIAASWLSHFKYSKTLMTEEESDRILNDLELLLASQKPFLDPDLTIDHLASKLGTRRHLLSRVLNERLKKSFYDLMQSYRIQHAITLLTDSTKTHYSIAAIGFESGFKSLSSFNAAFKKLTGKTPSFYRQHDQIPV